MGISVENLVCLLDYFAEFSKVHDHGQTVAQLINTFHLADFNKK